MYDVKDVAKLVVSICREKGYEITNLRLQKLLYFIEAFHYNKEKKPLLLGRMEAWDFGPVFPEVYGMYRYYGAGTLPSEDGVENKIEDNDKVFVGGILEKLKDYPTFQLVDISHKNGPWNDVYRKGEKNTIPEELMINYFVQEE